MSTDYILDVRVKNGPLLRLMRLRGHQTVAGLSRASGVSQTIIGSFLNLTARALDRRGQWRKSIVTLATYFHVLPENLFPPRHYDAALRFNRAEVEVSFSELPIKENLELIEHEDPETLAMDREAREKLRGAIDALTPRQAEVLRRRFGFEGDPETLESIAQSLGVNRERVRQIEHRGLNKLKSAAKKGELQRSNVG